MNKRATLRDIINLLGEEYMDADLSFSIRDGNLNHSWCTVSVDYGNFPRSKANEQTGEPARLTVNLYLDEHRLVKVKKS